jgi:hypothetical protein
MFGSSHLGENGVIYLLKQKVAQNVAIFGGSFIFLKIIMSFQM